MLATKNFRIAYENWCWATHAPGWREIRDIVQRVDKPKVGLCLDTFQSGGASGVNRQQSRDVSRDYRTPNWTRLGSLVAKS